ncbi:MAG: AraC family transcriptional regulator, partial [Chloroflexi bacterium]|nr:AraC family transcriptional regulator [Chloroflexota bacterium]
MYHLFFPVPPLKPFIECYWVAKSLPHQLDTLYERIFVDARADILFNFGCAYTRIRLDESRPEQLGLSNLDAQRAYPVIIQQTGEIHLVGVRFKPGGLAAFLPVPIYEISDLTLDIGTMFSSMGRDLESRLYDATSFQQHVGLLDAFFLKRLQPNSSHVYATESARQIERCGGAISIHALSQQVGYSIRTVDRLFRATYGVSPKTYARIVRFRRALQQLKQNPTLTLTSIAQNCGYYDQAHFAK